MFPYQSSTQVTLLTPTVTFSYSMSTKSAILTTPSWLPASPRFRSNTKTLPPARPCKTASIFWFTAKTISARRWLHLNVTDQNQSKFWMLKCPNYFERSESTREKRLKSKIISRRLADRLLSLIFSQYSYALSAFSIHDMACHIITTMLIKQSFFFHPRRLVLIVIS